MGTEALGGVNRPNTIHLALTKDETAEALGVSVRTVYTLWQTGELPYVRILSMKRTRVKDIEAYLERQRVRK